MDLIPIILAIGGPCFLIGILVGLLIREWIYAFKEIKIR